MNTNAITAIATPSCSSPPIHIILWQAIKFAIETLGYLNTIIARNPPIPPPIIEPIIEIRPGRGFMVDLVSLLVKGKSYCSTHQSRRSPADAGFDQTRSLDNPPSHPQEDLRTPRAFEKRHGSASSATWWQGGTMPQGLQLTRRLSVCGASRDESLNPKAYVRTSPAREPDPCPSP